MNKFYSTVKYYIVAAVILLSFFGTFQLRAADYYWVGGSGNWSDIGHWATSSGGGVKHTRVPGTDDNVFFDTNSFSSTGGSLTIDVVAECKNMDWTGAAGSLFVTGNANKMTIAGNFTLNSAILSWTDALLEFIGSGNHTIATHGVKFMGINNVRAITFNGGGTWVLQDGFYADSRVNLLQGTLNTNNQTATFAVFSGGTLPNIRKLILGNSVVTVNDWNFQYENALLEAGTSEIIVPTSINSSSFFFTNSTHSFHSIKLTSERNTTSAGLSINCPVERLEVFGNINFSGAATIANLILHAGKTYEFTPLNYRA